MQSWVLGDRANSPIFGPCLIVKSLGVSQVVHSAAVLDIHKDYIVKIQSLIFKFIWKEKQDKI